MSGVMGKVSPAGGSVPPSRVGLVGGGAQPQLVRVLATSPAVEVVSRQLSVIGWPSVVGRQS